MLVFAKAGNVGSKHFIYSFLNQWQSNVSICLVEALNRWFHLQSNTATWEVNGEAQRLWRNRIVGDQCEGGIKREHTTY